VRVYVARHGETTWNLAGRYQGRRESALTALGVRQGFALAEAFAHIEPRVERIIASPLLRCQATARFVADRLNVTLEIDDHLLEIAHGNWEGRLRDEIAANDPERFESWRERPSSVNFDGGESLVHVQSRWRDFVAAFNAEVPSLIVTHDAIVRVALLNALGRPLDDLWAMHVENAAYAEFDVANDSWTLIDENVTAHLAGLRATTEAQAL
jgi:broad specificity phosphatase PhoE